MGGLRSAPTPTSPETPEVAGPFRRARRVPATSRLAAAWRTRAAAAAVTPARSAYCRSAIAFTLFTRLSHMPFECSASSALALLSCESVNSVLPDWSSSVQVSVW